MPKNCMADSLQIEVQVVYAPSAKSCRAVTVVVPKGSSAEQAIALSGMLDLQPEIDAAAIAIGIFGKQVSLQTSLCEGDRIEIYRPLLADPKLARRLRGRKKQGKTENA